MQTSITCAECAGTRDTGCRCDQFDLAGAIIASTSVADLRVVVRVAGTRDEPSRPSLTDRLIRLVTELRGDRENLDLLLDDLRSAEPGDGVLWVVEQWEQTVDLERDEPDLVVDLLNRIRARR